MKLLKQNKGFSIVETLIGFGVLTGAVVGVMSLSYYQSLSQKQDQIKQNLQSSVDRIRLLIGDQIGCEVNFKTKILPTNFRDSGTSYSVDGIYNRAFSSGAWTAVTTPAEIAFLKSGSGLIDQANGLVLSTVGFQDFKGSNGSYNANLLVEVKNSTVNSYTLQKKIPIQFTIDEASRAILSCHGVNQSYLNLTPSIELGSCYQQDAGWGGTYCPSPAFVTDMYSNGGRWGGVDQFKCCQATAKNLLMEDGSVQDVPISVGSANDCTVVHDCNFGYCCLNRTQARLNDAGVWACSGLQSGGGNWEYDRFKQAKLTLPANTDPRYQLALKDCKLQGQADDSGWLCGLRPNGIIVDLYQTNGYCRDSCRPLCCELTISGP